MNDDHQSVVKTFFNHEVNSYFKNFHSLKSGNHYRFQRRIELVKIAAKDFAYCHLLECSSGTGEITREILLQNTVNYADIVDISPKMLAHTQQLLTIERDNFHHNLAINFIEADIFTFLNQAQTQDQFYDLVLCLGLIAHTGKLKELLQLIYPCLQPKGHILLQSSLLDHWGFKLVRNLTTEKYICQKGYAITDFYLQDIIDTAQNCGFTIVKQHRFGFYFPFGDNLWKWGNFYLEKFMEKIADKMGCDVILVLEKNQ
jgi:SAM-dependent methyltransferase